MEFLGFSAFLEFLALVLLQPSLTLASVRASCFKRRLNLSWVPSLGFRFPGAGPGCASPFAPATAWSRSPPLPCLPRSFDRGFHGLHGWSPALKSSYPCHRVIRGLFSAPAQTPPHPGVRCFSRALSSPTLKRVGPGNLGKPSAKPSQAQSSPVNATQVGSNLVPQNPGYRTNRPDKLK